MIVTHFVHNFTRWLHVQGNITTYLHCRSYTNLLAPQVHKMGLKADICNPEVSVPPPLRLQGLDGDGTSVPLDMGIRLPHSGAPLTDGQGCKNAGLLIPNKNLK